MMRRSVLLIALLAAACQRNDAAGPRMQITWDGAQTGSASLPMDFTWCPGQRMGILEAISNDTGMVIVFHEAEQLQAGKRNIIPPDTHGALPPWATAGFRVARDTMLLGFSSQYGSVTLTGSMTDGFGGTMELTLRRPGKQDSVQVTGHFDPTPVVGRTTGCVG